MFRRLTLIAVCAIAIELLIGGAAVLLFAWSGAADVAASSGHGPLANWFLHYTMRQSVVRHAAHIEPPPLDDPVLVLRGAAHYYDGCSPCHGAPDRLPSAITENETPPPPTLRNVFARWRPAEVFWIVKHGIKMTAMPPWPAQARDDEVWDVVAFLRRLPMLDEVEYRRLATGNVDASPDPTMLSALQRPIGPIVLNCARCHGLDGRGRDDAFPRLSAQDAGYIEQSLLAFRQGSRKSGLMQSASAGLNDTEIRQLAAHFAAKNHAAPLFEKCTPANDMDRIGAEIARAGTVRGDVLPCLACHDPDPATRSPGIPNLSGQPARYLSEQLRWFQTGVRSASPNAQVMSQIAQPLTADQISAVSAYFASRGIACSIMGETD